MDPRHPWKAPRGFDKHDMNDMNEEIDRLRRALCSMTRAYNSTKKELEEMKEATGFYDKTLPFLNLPREVRDQIYEYAFITFSYIKPELRPIYALGLVHGCWKPSTPGLCLVNKQIHKEGVEVLYGKNTFFFQSPVDFVRFEEQIGSNNRALVRSLEISMYISGSSAPDPDLVAPCDWVGVPSHWSRALMKSHLAGVVEMTMTVQGSGIYDRNLLIVSPVLQQAIENMLQRSTNANLKPQLTLKGFGPIDRERFPSDWKVNIEQWEEPSGGEDCDFGPLFD